MHGNPFAELQPGNDLHETVVVFSQFNCPTLEHALVVENEYEILGPFLNHRAYRTRRGTLWRLESVARVLKQRPLSS